MTGQALLQKSPSPRGLDTCWEQETWVPTMFKISGDLKSFPVKCSSFPLYFFTRADLAWDGQLQQSPGIAGTRWEPAGSGHSQPGSQLNSGLRPNPAFPPMSYQHFLPSKFKQLPAQPAGLCESHSAVSISASKMPVEIRHVPWHWGLSQVAECCDPQVPLQIWLGATKNAL